jgi:adenosyl cobinamide kinase/adenosyl cobinamide phosphate guanylyltransferase
MAHKEIAIISPTTEPVACSPAAQRMRHHRERRRLGLRCVVVQVEVETLIRRGLLEADARNDRYAVRDALHTHLARTLVQHRDAKQPVQLIPRPST